MKNTCLIRPMYIRAVLILSTFVPIAIVADVLDPQGDADKLAYSLGYMMGMQASDFADLNVTWLQMGLMQGYQGKPSKIEAEDMQQRIHIAQRNISQQRQTQHEMLRKQAIDWLAENVQRAEVQSTESGLQYQILQEGSGRKPTTEDRITVHYEGRLIDGSVFDSSYARGQPVTFALKGLIAGWQEALPLMSTGSKWRLFIPPELGYGQRGAGGNIGPYAVLIFDLELVAIEQ